MGVMQSAGCAVVAVVVVVVAKIQSKQVSDGGTAR